jgi:hypothetical protein
MEMATGRLAIQLAASDQVIAQIEAPGVEGQILGRSDTSSTFQPDVDLSASDARDKGVSRRHAVLVRYRGAIHVIDLGSVNVRFSAVNASCPISPTRSTPATNSAWRTSPNIN